MKPYVSTTRGKLVSFLILDQNKSVYKKERGNKMKKGGRKRNEGKNEKRKERKKEGREGRGRRQGGGLQREMEKVFLRVINCLHLNLNHFAGDHDKFTSPS